MHQNARPPNCGKPLTLKNDISISHQVIFTARILNNMIECQVCHTEKSEDKYYKNRFHTCKDCHNVMRKKREELYISKASEIKKVCKNCKNEKSGTEFHYTRSVCKKCVSEAGKEEKHRPAPDAPDKTCNKCNILKPASAFRHNSLGCKECSQKLTYKWRENNHEKFLNMCRKYRNKPDYREKQNEYKRNKYNSDVNEKLKALTRMRVRYLLKKPLRKDNMYLELLGETYDHVRRWLEFNFDENMTWENHGTYWDIDHIIPCSKFDFTDIEEAKACFNWRNLAPLEKIENIKKHAKIDSKRIAYYENRAVEFTKLISLKKTDTE
jgi:hypothetical protein